MKNLQEGEQQGAKRRIAGAVKRVVSSLLERAGEALVEDPVDYSLTSSAADEHAGQLPVDDPERRRLSSSSE